MASANPFDLLGDSDNDDPSQLIAAQQQKIAAKKPAPAAAPPAAVKLPSKPIPPAQAVREVKSNAATAGGGAGRGRGRHGGWTGPKRGVGNGDANGFTGGHGGGSIADEGDAAKPFERERGGHASQRQPYRGGRRGGYINGEAGGDSERPPRRVYERHNGTGRGYEMKREGSGRGNWGTRTDDMLTQLRATDDNGNIDEKLASPEKQPEQEDGPLSVADKDNKEGEANESEEKELEDKCLIVGSVTAYFLWKKPD
ncbi:plasminogen activator inhibitor 1 RNA-binding protein-like [Cocos nucifera]|uniref:Plasminogen activator inhibitor 1 RNA-binding protein-like n=1 Tax=Cocos nucifera TaxID=13894 RepID=A0A8K0I4Q9_COCNU|nr:plasminogen activator inhibitor 1 RNA-binding protein-like [Cocos nucifera]KAG1335346.1 plasminogen activator inhibitor 1 RNA-binding protein-like [Cocos nucifera]